MRTYLALLLLAVASLRADVEFSGFFITSHDALFSLTDTETKRASGWLKIGQSFGGYRVVSFDRANEVITLAQGERMRPIALRASKVKDGRATIHGSLKFLNGEIEGVHAVLFMGEEASFPLKNGMTFRIKPDQLPDGNIGYDTKFVTMEQGTERTLSSLSVVAIPGKSFGIKIGDYGFSFTP
jgi:hypothetical protein